MKIAGDHDLHSKPKIQSLASPSPMNSAVVSGGYNFDQLNQESDAQVEITENKLSTKNIEETLATSLTNSSISSPEIESSITLKMNADKNNDQLSKIEEFKIDQDIIDSLCKFQRPHLSSLQLRFDVFAP